MVAVVCVPLEGHPYPWRWPPFCSPRVAGTHTSTLRYVAVHPTMFSVLLLFSGRTLARWGLIHSSFSNHGPFSPAQLESAHGTGRPIVVTYVHFSFLVQRMAPFDVSDYECSTLAPGPRCNGGANTRTDCENLVGALRPGLINLQRS